MQGGGIPESLREFLLAHIDSIEQLEVLILLRSTPTREWSAAEVNLEVKSSESSIRTRLASLASQGFLVTSGDSASLRYRYQPADDAMMARIDALAAVYRERRIAVINLIYTRPESDAVSFANAFKLTKTGKDR